MGDAHGYRQSQDDSATGALALAALRRKVATLSASRPEADFPSSVTTIPIVGETDVFAVRRIYCIGRNYAAHAIERGSDPTREPPFFFRADRRHPERHGRRGRGSSLSVADQELSHEVELVAALKSGAPIFRRSRRSNTSMAMRSVWI